MVPAQPVRANAAARAKPAAVTGLGDIVGPLSGVGRAAGCATASAQENPLPRGQRFSVRGIRHLSMTSRSPLLTYRNLCTTLLLPARGVRERPSDTDPGVPTLHPEGRQTRLSSSQERVTNVRISMIAGNEMKADPAHVLPRTKNTMAVMNATIVRENAINWPNLACSISATAYLSAVLM